MSTPPRSSPRRLRKLLQTRGGAEAIEDELAAPSTASSGLPRLTPRSSTLKAELPRATPPASLRQLAGVIHKSSTPGPRLSMPPENVDSTPALGAQPQSRARPRAFRTAPAKKGPPTTPHAIRALRQRKAAALTPSRDRRKSRRLQRETPRDALRKLSRILAPATQRPQLLSEFPRKTENEAQNSERDELGDGYDLPKPRLSMPIDDLEDDSFAMPPPRLSAPLDDEIRTQRSIEVGRRAISEQPLSRLSRGSFGSVRLSDQFTNADEFELDEIIADNGGLSAFGSDVGGMDDSTGPIDDTIADALETGRPIAESLSGSQGRPSDRQLFSQDQDGDDNTFAFQIPTTLLNHLSPPAQGIGSDSEQPLEDSTIPLTTQKTANFNKKMPAPKRIAKAKKVSRHGIAYSSLPNSVMKKLVATFARSTGVSSSKINKDTLEAISKASHQYFQQVAEDLGAYANHAGRKTIHEKDMITLMKRQKQLTVATTPFSLAQKYLPRELLQEIRMVPPMKTPQRKSRRLETLDEEED